MANASQERLFRLLRAGLVPTPKKKETKISKSSNQSAVGSKRKNDITTGCV
jgi:hypothetical protein